MNTVEFADRDSLVEGYISSKYKTDTVLIIFPESEEHNIPHESKSWNKEFKRNTVKILKELGIETETRNGVLDLTDIIKSEIIVVPVTKQRGVEIILKFYGEIGEIPKIQLWVHGKFEDENT